MSEIDVLAKAQSDYGDRRMAVEMSLQEYLAGCRDDPMMYAGPAERMLDAIGEPELVDTSKDERLGRIFQNRTLKHYPFFSDFFGMEEVIERLVGFLRHAAQGLEERKQILYLLGPVGGGKSSLAERLKQLMEERPIHVLKAGDRISPIYESPLGLFDIERHGRQLHDDYGIPSHKLPGMCSAWALKRLDEYEGDFSRFTVVRTYPSKLGRTHTREKPAGLLWGRSGEEQARASLRQALAGLRRALASTGAEVVVARGDGLSLDPEAVVADVDRFGLLVEAGDARSLEEAVALYQYRQCRDLLRRELGVPLSAETERLAGEIRAEQPGQARPVTGPQDSGAGVASEGKQRSRPTLAVKAFENISGEPAQNRYADALTNGIVTSLTKISGIALISDESRAFHRSKRMTPRDLADKFDVEHVLRGGISQYGERVRITAELTHVPTNRIVWAEQFDREVSDVGEFLAIQDEITEEIVTALDVKLLSGEAGRIVRNLLRNPAAREHLYRGEDVLWNATTRIELREAQREFSGIIRLEPSSSVGYANAALAYWVEIMDEFPDPSVDSAQRAMELAQQAIELGDVTGYPLLVLAHMHLIEREYGKAFAAADEAVLVRPNCPAAYALKASVLTYLGRAAEAVEVARFAVRLTPVQPPIFPAILATAYYGCERHEEAVTAARAAIEINETDVDPYLIMSASSVALGRADEARRLADKVIELEPEFELAGFAASQPYKDRERLDLLLNRLEDAGLK